MKPQARSAAMKPSKPKRKPKPVSPRTPAHRTLVRGDYVLATKYKDGSPCDHFYVGFFREMLGCRYLVEDEKGKLVRANGFRRCERISNRVGHALVAAMQIISSNPWKSVWWWRRHVKALHALLDWIGNQKA
jgi:hypothetical protein